ncbi:MAG: phenylalanine--tRNA ligase subunit beta [Halobacteriales archaeon]|nr:phenylalanine--tRNA ligase subunit beta [Halobacteriales archaeon]
MAVVEVELEELNRLTRREMSRDEVIDELFGLGVEFEGDGDEGLQFEVVPDRPDRLSVEGLARSLRYQFGDDRGVRVPKVAESDYKIRVKGVPERPYIVGAVIRNVDLSGGVLDSLIQLQEKLHSTLGRRRNKGAIGVHDLTMLKGEEVVYRDVEPEEDTFVPLEIGDAQAREMTPGEVMREHPVGKEYARVLEGAERVPAIYDDIGLFSFPPIINGKRTEVREDSRDLLVEMTGTDEWTVDKMLNILVYALSDRGATIEEVEIEYEDRRTLKPDLETESKTVTHERIESVLGVEIPPDEVIDLLERSGMDVAEFGDSERKYEVDVPPYRTDVMHPLDLVDDVGRAYGFNEMEPRYPDVSTVGGLTDSTRLENAVRKQLVGLGFQDLLNFVLTSPKDCYGRMRLDADGAFFPEGDAVNVENPYSEDYSLVRSWLLPSLVSVLANNTHREYPQNLAEVGFCAVQDDSENTGVREETHIAGVVCGTEAGYEFAKSRLVSLVEDFDATVETPATEHASFIEGRAAKVVIDGEDAGLLGELHPEILAEREILQPTATFEFEIDALR